jgi:hypothetical protein
MDHYSPTTNPAQDMAALVMFSSDDIIFPPDKLISASLGSDFSHLSPFSGNVATHIIQQSRKRSPRLARPVAVVRPNKLPPSPIKCLVGMGK